MRCYTRPSSFTMSKTVPVFATAITWVLSRRWSVSTKHFLKRSVSTIKQFLGVCLKHHLANWQSGTVNCTTCRVAGHVWSKILPFSLHLTVPICQMTKYLTDLRNSQNNVCEPHTFVSHIPEWHRAHSTCHKNQIHAPMQRDCAVLSDNIKMTTTYDRDTHPGRDIRVIIISSY